MAVRRQRATTSETYAFDRDYNIVLSKAKRFHKSYKEFYLYQVGEYWTSITTSEIKDFSLMLEHWLWNGTRWVKQ